jgi:hypothetical protein
MPEMSVFGHIRLNDNWHWNETSEQAIV